MTPLQQLQKAYVDKLKPIFQVDFDEAAGRGMAEYLKNELIGRELKSFGIGKRYGVKTIDELDEALSSGRLKEENVVEDDYIELTELAKETTAIKGLMAEFSYG